MTLFDHVKDKFALDELISEATTDENGVDKELDDSTKAALLQLAEQWKTDFRSKAERIAQFWTDLENFQDACDAEIKRLQARKKSAENKVKALKFIVQSCLEWLNLPKIQAGLFSLSVQQNPPSCEILDEEKLSPEFYQIETVKKIDKVKILKYMKENNLTEIDGARKTQSKGARLR